MLHDGLWHLTHMSPRKLVAYTRCALPPSRRRRIARRVCRAMKSSSTAALAGIAADAFVHQRQPSLTDVDYDVRQEFCATLLMFALFQLF